MNNERIKDVSFTPRQIAFLEQEFPEVPGTSETSNEELRWRAAQRAVVAHCRYYQAKGNN